MPRPFSALASVSAVVFLLSAALSLRARWAMDQLFISSPAAGNKPVVIRNRIYALTAEWDSSQKPWVPTRVWHDRRLRSDAYSRFNRARSDFAVPGFQFVYGEAQAAHWLISVITLPLPVLALFRWVYRSKRYAGGQCAACGYDLRASSGRCPECGALVPTGSTTPIDSSAKPVPLSPH